MPSRRQRRRPARLPEKLLEVREKLGLSQGGMCRLLGGGVTREYVSKYERGVLEPPLNVLLTYARLLSKTGRGEFLEALIDDSLNLPSRIPAAPPKYSPRPSKEKGASN